MSIPIELRNYRACNSPTCCSIDNNRIRNIIFNNTSNPETPEFRLFTNDYPMLNQTIWFKPLFNSITITRCEQRINTMHDLFFNNDDRFLNQIHNAYSANVSIEFDDGNIYSLGYKKIKFNTFNNIIDEIEIE